MLLMSLYWRAQLARELPGTTNCGRGLNEGMMTMKIIIIIIIITIIIIIIIINWRN